MHSHLDVTLLSAQIRGTLLLAHLGHCPISFMGAIIAIIILYGLLWLSWSKIILKYHIQHAKSRIHLASLHKMNKLSWPSGGYKQGDVPYIVMSEYLSPHQIPFPLNKCKFHFEGCRISHGPISLNPNTHIINVQIPLPELICLISLKDGLELA